LIRIGVLRLIGVEEFGWAAVAENESRFGEISRHFVGLSVVGLK
jgi:hypothetical protein